MAPSPARLSSLSTSLLTSLVELSRLQSLDLAPPPAAKASVLKNLTSLRSGIVALQREGTADGEIMDGLKKQYGRLMGLVIGMGMEEEVKGMGLDEEEEEDQDMTPRPKDPPTGNLLGDEGGETPRPRESWDHAGLEDGRPQLPKRDELREDEEDIRRQNHDVQVMQRVMMEGPSPPHLTASAGRCRQVGRTDQDRTLDDLSLAISRQRDLSLHISSELETQEALLEGLDEDLDHTDSRLRRAGNKLERFAKKSRENGATCTIIGLIVVLLVRPLTFFPRETKT